MMELKAGDRVHVYYNDTDYVVGTFKSRDACSVIIHADGDPENAERIFPAGDRVRKLRKIEKKAQSKAKPAA